MVFKSSVPSFVVVALSQLLALQDEKDTVCNCKNLKAVSVDLERCLESREALDVGVACLRQMKDLRRAIQSLSKTVEEEVATIERAVIPASRARGFSRLPKDIFSYVLDLLARSCTDRSSREQLIRSLSAVSRRFRDGIDSTTSLWSSWDDWALYRSPTMFTRVQQLSIESPIHINTESRSLQYIDSLEDLTRFLRACVCHKYRWRSLRTDASRVAALIRQEEGFRELSFPTVKRLSLSGSSTDRTSVHTFLANWSFPGVTALSMQNMLPPHGIFEDVIRLSLSGQLDQDFQEILDVLQQFRRLERLNIDDALFTFGRGLDRSTWHNHFAVAPVELPKLRHLQLCNKTQGGDSHTPCPELVLRLFLESLRMPLLRSIGARLHSLADNTSFLGIIFACESHVLDTVESFALEELGAGGKRCYRSTTLGSFLASFPKLSSLKLASCDDIGYLIDFRDKGKLKGRLSNLRELTLQYAKTFDAEITHSLPGELIKSFLDSGAALDQLVVVSKSQEALHDAQSVFPRARREWYTSDSILT